LKPRRKIPFAVPYITKEDVKAVAETIRRTQLSQGPKVEEFERAFAKYLGVKYAVAVFNCTVALHVALAALGIGQGDEIIVPPFTFIATANAVVYQNAKPVFADIDSKTYNIDPNQVKKAITSKTKAIIPVHYGGHPAEMDEIMEIAEKHDLTVIEDAAEAHGAEYKGKKAGNLAHIACFSFYPNKSMTTGEGGMIVTNDAKLAETMKLLRSHGQDYRYHHVLLGYNYRMTELQAALGVVQLKRLDKIVNCKQKLARYYTEQLSETAGLEPPYVSPHVKHGYFLYTIRVKKRDQVQTQLEKSGIETRVCFPSVHLQPIYRQLYGYKGGEYPVSEKASDTVLSIPIHYSVSTDDQEYIVKHLKEALITV